MHWILQKTFQQRLYMLSESNLRNRFRQSRDKVNCRESYPPCWIFWKFLNFWDDMLNNIFLTNHVSQLINVFHKRNPYFSNRVLHNLNNWREDISDNIIFVNTFRELTDGLSHGSFHVLRLVICHLLFQNWQNFFDQNWGRTELGNFRNISDSLRSDFWLSISQK